MSMLVWRQRVVAPEGFEKGLNMRSGLREGRMAHRLLRHAVVGGCVAAGLLLTPMAQAEPKAEKTFTAMVMDAQGADTEIHNLIFYWEEKISETAFVPYELRHLPIKRGSTANNIPFDKMKQVETKPAVSEGGTMLVMLARGKTGEFVLTMPGSVHGESDFGQADVPAKSVAKVVSK